jgi:hypothetical protein
MVIVIVVYDATRSINAKLSSVISMTKIGDGVMQDLMMLSIAVGFFFWVSVWFQLSRK